MRQVLHLHQHFQLCVCCWHLHWSTAWWLQLWTFQMRSSSGGDVCGDSSMGTWADTQRWNPLEASQMPTWSAQCGSAVAFALCSDLWGCWTPSFPRYTHSDETQGPEQEGLHQCARGWHRPEDVPWFQQTIGATLRMKVDGPHFAGQWWPIDVSQEAHYFQRGWHSHPIQCHLHPKADFTLESQWTQKERFPTSCYTGSIQHRPRPWLKELDQRAASNFQIWFGSSFVCCNGQTGYWVCCQDLVVLHVEAEQQSNGSIEAPGILFGWNSRQWCAAQVDRRGQNTVYDFWKEDVLISDEVAVPDVRTDSQFVLEGLAAKPHAEVQAQGSFSSMDPLWWVFAGHKLRWLSLPVRLSCMQPMDSWWRESTSTGFASFWLEMDVKATGRRWANDCIWILHQLLALSAEQEQADWSTSRSSSSFFRIFFAVQWSQSTRCAQRSILVISTPNALEVKGAVSLESWLDFTNLAKMKPMMTTQSDKSRSPTRWLENNVWGWFKWQVSQWTCACSWKDVRRWWTATTSMPMMSMTFSWFGGQVWRWWWRGQQQWPTWFSRSAAGSSTSWCNLQVWQWLHTQFSLHWEDHGLAESQVPGQIHHPQLLVADEPTIWWVQSTIPVDCMVAT